MLLVLLAASLLAISALVMSVIRMTASPPPATTTTVTAPPPPPPNYSPEQIASAKKEACDASEAAALSVNNSQQNLIVAARDRKSPQYGPALANFQLVVAIETKYMQQHLPPATPNDVVKATNDYIAALVAVADGETRGVSNPDADALVDRANNIGDRLNKACG
ncbi:hypothetical protein [Mycobacterium sp. 1245852.3]|uniref:hypothetical protein n=1 Tax=Mycobacterium sp. 1245852.3 TaxID=1856860 RepID=UPI001E3A126E|nr:hypothetical protein [Mycobacterium sp. 1245852.3]